MVCEMNVKYISGSTYYVCIAKMCNSLDICSGKYEAHLQKIYEVISSLFCWG